MKVKVIHINQCVKKMSLELVYFIIISLVQIHTNGISGVMVSVLTSSTVNRGFEPRSGQTKD